jgi:hypothetical protein
MTAAGQLGAGRGAARRRGLTCTTSAMSCSTAPIASPRSTAPPPVHRGVGIAEALKKKALGVQDRWDHKGVGVTPRPAGRADPSRAERAPAWRARPQLGWAAISSRSVKRQPFLSPRICESRVVRGLVSRYTRPWRRRVQLGHGHGDGDGDGGGGRWFRSALPGRQGKEETKGVAPVLSRPLAAPARPPAHSTSCHTNRR